MSPSTLTKFTRPAVTFTPVIDDLAPAADDGITEFSASLVEHLFQHLPAAPSALENLVARIHRRHVAPRGFRFVANIDLTDFSRAVRAVRQSPVASALRLITPAVDDAGQPVPDGALYIREGLPEPESFWILFHSLGHEHDVA